MSSFRGFDTYLISRAERAGSHWFDTDTLRYFDSFGGKSQRVGPDVYVLVTSERDHSAGTLGAAWDGQRRYSVRVFTFHPKSDARPWDDALTIETATVKPTDDNPRGDGFGAFADGKSAGRYADKVTQSIHEAFPHIHHSPRETHRGIVDAAPARPVSAADARAIAELVTSL